MKGQLPNPVQEVYSSDGWTQWNPLLSTENRPAHISSVYKGMSSILKFMERNKFSSNFQQM